MFNNCLLFHGLRVSIPCPSVQRIENPLSERVAPVVYNYPHRTHEHRAMESDVRYEDIRLGLQLFHQNEYDRQGLTFHRPPTPASSASLPSNLLPDLAIITYNYFGVQAWFLINPWKFSCFLVVLASMFTCGRMTGYERQLQSCRACGSLIALDKVRAGKHLALGAPHWRCLLIPPSSIKEITAAILNYHVYLAFLSSASS